MKPLPLLFVMLATPAILFSQKKVYVNSKVRGGINDGSSWMNAYNSLSRALKVSGEATIYIAEGIYKPEFSSSGTKPADPRQATFYINCGVELQGGYRVKGNEADYNPATYKTIFSGDVRGDDSGTLSNPNLFHPNRNENIYQLLYFTECKKDFRPRRFENIEFTGAHNYAGGSFLGNILVTANNDVVFSNCRAYLNVGTEALVMKGVVTNAPGKLTLENCTAEQNFAGRFAWLSYVNLDCKESTFINTYYYNSFFFDSPLLTAYGYVNSITKCFFHEPTLTVATFRLEGAAYNDLQVTDSKFYIKSTLLDVNKTSDTLTHTYSKLWFMQCLVSRDNSFPSTMIKINLLNYAVVDPIIKHCTINSYPASSLPFMTVNVVVNGVTTFNSPFRGYTLVEHSIIWGFPDTFCWVTSQGRVGSAWFYMPKSDFQTIHGNYTLITFPGFEPWMTSDPIFIAPLGSDGLAGTPDDNLHLKFNFFLNIISPCIDAGRDTVGWNWPYPPLDIDGNNRIQGLIDIGCYERCKCLIF